MGTEEEAGGAAWSGDRCGAWSSSSSLLRLFLQVGLLVQMLDNRLSAPAFSALLFPQGPVRGVLL